MTFETIKLLGSTKNKKARNKNGKNVPHLEKTKVILVDCHIVNSGYLQDPRVLCTFILNKSATNLMFLKTCIIYIYIYNIYIYIYIYIYIHISGHN